MRVAATYAMLTCALAMIGGADELAIAENAGDSTVADTPTSAAAQAESITPLFDGFEGAAVADFWRPGDAGDGRYELGAVAIEKDFVRAGDRAVRITVREGDIEQTGDGNMLTERAELDSGKHAFIGRDLWYGFSVLVPPSFPVVENRLVIAQWKQHGVGGSPLVAQRYRGGRHQVTIRMPDSSSGPRKYYSLPEIEFGKWNDMVYHIRFSTGSDGVVEAWMNGKQVVAYEGVTAFERGRNSIYNKIGLYRDRWKAPMTIYFDNYTLGESYAAVDPSRFDQKAKR